jgi:ATP-binding cassette subfamily F protein 3
VSVLSGGERGRLALARMLLQPANFLILDEPTNHLDLHSQEVLQRALGDYTGAFAIVSHNRSFLDPIVTKVLEFIPGQKPKLYYGNVSDYLEKKKADMEIAVARVNFSAAGGTKSSSANVAGSSDSGANRKEQRRLDAKAREERAQKLRPLRKEFEALEAEIAKLETAKAELDDKLADPGFFKKGDDASTAMKRYSEVETLLESRVAKWGELSDKIEKLEAEG